METIPEIKEINSKIVKVKALLEELNSDAHAFPALFRNTKRALASVKMLELNISDVVDLKTPGA